jgi:hypothetical protein
VYGEPAPDGCTPLGVAIDPQPDLVVEAPRIPDPRPFRVAGLDEEFPVHEGRVPIAVPLSVQGRAEAVTLTIHVRFQACTESLCYPPAEATLTLPLTGLGAIRD